MVARSVSMWGPNAQGVRSRPNRSVSLQPELLRAQQMRPQQMGGVFHWGGYGNPPALWQSGPDGRGFWGLTSDLESRRFLEAAAEQARREGKDVPPDPEAGSAEEGNWVTKIYDYLGRTPRYISLPDEGGITDDVPEPADGDAVEHVPDPVPEPPPEPDDGRRIFFQGLPRAYDMGGTFPTSMNAMADSTRPLDPYEDADILDALWEKGGFRPVDWPNLTHGSPEVVEVVDEMEGRPTRPIIPMPDRPQPSEAPSGRPIIPMPDRPQPSRPIIQLGPDKPQPSEAPSGGFWWDPDAQWEGEDAEFSATQIPSGIPGFGNGAARREMQAAMQASSQRVNPQQEVFDGMGGWREQLAAARAKLREAERREAERTAARRIGRPIPKGPPIPGNRNPESGAASRFAPSGQLPVDPSAFGAPQGQTVDWFNNLSTEQKIGMALMLMSGGMAAGGGAAAVGGGAALRGGAALLPLILNQ